MADGRCDERRRRSTSRSRRCRLFGLFFVGTGLAQLVWPLWLLLRRWRPLLVLGALGNGLIVVMWVVDRLWGLPLGPEHWKPDPVGFGDSATTAFEVLLVVVCIALLRRGKGPRLDRRSLLALTLGVGSSLLTPTQ